MIWRFNLKCQTPQQKLNVLFLMMQLKFFSFFGIIYGLMVGNSIIFMAGIAVLVVYIIIAIKFALSKSENKTEVLGKQPSVSEKRIMEIIKQERIDRIKAKNKKKLADSEKAIEEEFED